MRTSIVSEFFSRDGHFLFQLVSKRDWWNIFCYIDFFAWFFSKLAKGFSSTANDLTRNKSNSLLQNGANIHSPNICITFHSMFVLFPFRMKIELDYCKEPKRTSNQLLMRQIPVLTDGRWCYLDCVLLRNYSSITLDRINIWWADPNSGVSLLCREITIIFLNLKIW